MDEKYSVRWAEEKRKTCKVCLKRESWGFCRRHAPRMRITTRVIKTFTPEQLEALLEKTRQAAYKEGLSAAVDYIEEEWKHCPIGDIDEMQRYWDDMALKARTIVD